MDKKTKAGLIIRFIMLAACVIATIVVLSINIDEVAASGEAENVGEAIGEAVGLSLAIAMLLVIEFMFMGGVALVGTVGLIFSSRKIAISVGKERVINIVQTAIFALCILIVLVKFLILVFTGMVSGA